MACRGVFIKKVACVQRLEVGEGVNSTDIWGKNGPSQGTAGAQLLNQNMSGFQKQKEGSVASMEGSSNRKWRPGRNKDYVTLDLVATLRTLACILHAMDRNCKWSRKAGTR